MPRVSIVMTSYQQEDFVGPAIESVRAQTFPDWELVVVDDGSRDRSHERAANVAGKDGRIRALRKENGGHCSALNFGLAACATDSEFLFFLDGDDLIKPRHFETTTAYLGAHPEVGLVCCQADQADHEGRIVDRFHRSRWVPGRWGVPRDLRALEAMTPFVTFFCATGQGMSGLYRRSVFSQTSGWDLRFTRHEDTDMFCQMALLAEVHYLPNVLYTYRIHQQNITRLTDAEAVNTFSTFKMGGYSSLREKWDNFTPRNQEEARTLASALRHYYGIHRPLRSLRVSWMAWREFLRTRRPGALRWSAACAWEGLAGASAYWILRRTGRTN